MKYLPVSARFILGLIFLILGANKFLNFLSMPVPPREAQMFYSALAETRYFFQFHASLEIIIGILLLSRFYVPLALVAAFPIAIHVMLFHLFLDPAGLPAAFVILALDLYLGWVYRKSYQGLLQARVDYLD